MPTVAISGQTTFGAATTGTTTQLDNNFLLAYNAINSFNQYSNYLVDSGAANAYVVTKPAGTTLTLTTGLPIQFKAANANTGASTFNADATGAKNILNADGSPLKPGQIQAGGIINVIYDGTQYMLVGQFGRGWTLLQTVAAAASATVDLTAISTYYDNYMVTLTDVQPETSGANLHMRISQAATFRAGASDYGYVKQGYDSTPGYFQSASTGAAQILLAASVASDTTSKNFFSTVYLSKPTQTARVKPIMWEQAWTDGAGHICKEHGSGFYVGTTSGGTTSAIDGARFLMSAGNITTGSFSLFGLAK